MHLVPTPHLSASTNLACYLFSGGLSSKGGGTVNIAEGVSFSGNSAAVNGGTMSIDSLNALDIVGATFTLNEASSGGAVWVIATINDAYRFVLAGTSEANSATDGGALYLFNSETVVDIGWDGPPIFRDNVAGNNKTLYVD